MSLIPWDNVTLTAVVNKRRPVKTPIWDRHFSRAKQATAPTIQLDFVNGPEGVMVVVDWDAASRKAVRGSVTTQSIKLPRFTEHDLITFMDVMAYRQPGTIGGTEAFDSFVMGKLDDLRKRIDRTKEVLAIGALTGDVKDGDGNSIVTFALDAAEGVNFKTADGVDAFDDAVTAITRELGEQPGEVVAYCGASAYKYVRKNPTIAKLLNSVAGTDLITTGNLPNVSGVRIERMPLQYVDNSGATVSFVGDTDIIIVPVGPYFEGVQGPCVGEGGRPALTGYYAETIVMNDPNATKIRVESNPLPVVTRPKAIRRITASYS